MPLETTPASIADLNILWPLAGDPGSQGDDHIRLIKDAIKKTFPNINAPVTASPAQMNFLVGVTSAIQTQLNTLSTGISTLNARNIGTGTGLTGGGNLSADRTLAVDSTVVRTSGAFTLLGVLTTVSRAYIGTDTGTTFNTSDNAAFGTQLTSFSDVGRMEVQTKGTQPNGSLTFRNWWGNVETMRVRADGNIQNTNNSYGAISDARKKTNVEDINAQLEELRQLRVVKYNLIGRENEPKHSGLIAQEVLALKPGLVELGEDGFYGVKYSILVPLLLKALQELADRVDALEAR